MAKPTPALVGFKWRVHRDGYDWVESADSDIGPTLQPRGQRAGVREYQPLHADSGLYRQFVETVPNRDGFLTFADRYGALLGIHGRPELLMEWQSQHERLRGVIELWDLLRAGDEKGLAERIVWGQDDDGLDGVRYIPAASSLLKDPEIIASARLFGSALDYFRPGDVFLPATFYIQGWINRRLSEHVAPRINYDPTLVENPGRLVLQLEPKDLLGRPWLQFTQAVTGNKDFRRCLTCGNWFEASPGSARSDKRYCSGACRARFSRERPERASRLRTEGKTITEIADLFGAQPSEVQTWIRQHQQAAKARQKKAR